jgi:2-polyprenyl-6-hydroxyphenyl methylase/3-demethylubiquinone-9 3-methyltransferase
VAEAAGSFDVVTCMEMLEHVPDPASMVGTLGALLRPGGDLFLSTLNRTPKAFAVAIVGAEYVARLLPRGTHEYAKFIKPSELAGYGRDAALQAEELIGMTYNPLTRVFRLEPDTAVNYLLACRKPAA